jgi:hypothetical protein
MMFDLILDVMKAVFCYVLNHSVSSEPRSVQSSRWDGAIFLIIPGTSCLATVVLSLRDKIDLTAEALLKLALMGFQPWESYLPAKSPEGLQIDCVNSIRQTYG